MRGPQSKVHADALEKRKRDDQILNMRHNLRMTERQIAQQVGLSQPQVSNILHKILRERIRERQDKADELTEALVFRSEQRYQQLLAIARGQATTKRLIKKDGEWVEVEVPPTIAERIQAMQSMQANDDSLRRTLGLDAPVKVEHSFRQEPMSPEEIAKMREEATPEELQAIAAGNQEVMIAVLTRANVPLLSN